MTGTEKNETPERITSRLTGIMVNVLRDIAGSRGDYTNAIDAARIALQAIGMDTPRVVDVAYGAWLIELSWAFDNHLRPTREPKETRAKRLEKALRAVDDWRYGIKTKDLTKLTEIRGFLASSEELQELKNICKAIWE